ncbi:histone H2B.2-like [Sphaerodactylus townsendi]|uniref:histone H2B.2-like n=1 Tax=Sphaerodactylus townsendi TaxID=933632 RepID=UPI0020265CB5|nr:histone H2B.2-like [Sphaerodactylus townsendi]
MAAKQQGNRKTMKTKKNLQKKRQAAAKKHKRVQSKKQKKRQASEAGSRPVLSISSPRMFATKILQQMPKVRMETKARGLMKTLLMDVYDQVSNEVENLMQNKEPSALDPAEVQAALKEAMTRELEKHSAEPDSVETAAA